MNIKTLANLARANGIENTRKLRDDIVSEYTNTINDLNSVEESMIKTDISLLPVYQINEYSNNALYSFNKKLDKSNKKESKGKLKNISKVVKIRIKCQTELDKFNKMTKQEQSVHIRNQNFKTIFRNALNAEIYGSGYSAAKASANKLDKKMTVKQYKLDLEEIIAKCDKIINTHDKKLSKTNESYIEEGFLDKFKKKKENTTKPQTVEKVELAKDEREKIAVIVSKELKAIINKYNSSKKKEIRAAIDSYINNACDKSDPDDVEYYKDEFGSYFKSGTPRIICDYDYTDDECISFNFLSDNDNGQDMSIALNSIMREIGKELKENSKVSELVSSVTLFDGDEGAIGIKYNASKCKKYLESKVNESYIEDYNILLNEGWANDYLRTVKPDISYKNTPKFLVKTVLKSNEKIVEKWENNLKQFKKMDDKEKKNHCRKLNLAQDVHDMTGNSNTYLIDSISPENYEKIANDIINAGKKNIQKCKKIISESYAIDLDVLQYVMESKDINLEKAIELIRDVNDISESCQMYCVLPRSINENTSLKEFINLSESLIANDIIPLVTETK